MLAPRKAVALFAVAVSALLVTVVSAGLWREHAYALSLARATTQNLARVLEEHARQSLRRVGLSLRAAADDVQSARGSPGRGRPGLREALRVLLPPDGLVRAFVVTGADGTIDLAVPDDAVAGLTSVSSRDFFTALRGWRELRTELGAPLVAGARGSRLLPVSRPLAAADGSFGGVVFALLDPAYFQDFYDSLDTGGAGFVTLFLRDGPIVVRSPPSEVLAADQVERIYSYRALQDYPVVVSIGVSVDDSLAAWRTRAARDAALLLATLAAIAAAALLFNRQLAQREAAEVRLALALEGAGNALWDLDLRRGEVVLSERWAQMLGAPAGPTRATAEALMRLVHPEDAARVREALQEALRAPDGQYSVEHRVRKADGSWLWILSRGKVSARGARGRALRITGINADISARKLAAERLEQLAFYDPLTGAANRAMLVDRLDRAAARSRRGGTLLALMYMDIDRFKSINDSFGHAAGDALLREFAARLKRCVRDTDTVARLGGDEFVVLLEDVKEGAVAERIAGKILLAAAAPVTAEAREIAVTTSIGIALHDREEEVEALQKRADAALYEAKRAGRNTFRVAR